MGTRIPTKPRFTPPAQMKGLINRKKLDYKGRKNLIKHYWDDVNGEYTEANHPTNLYNMFSEMLESIPKEVLSECETLGLFKGALIKTIGKEKAKSKNKIYI